MASGRPPIWKQILGAVIGGSLGLIVYSGYQSGKPAVQAWLTIPQSSLTNPSSEGTRISNTTVDEEQQERFRSRALEIEKNFARSYERYQLEEEPAVEEEPVPDTFVPPENLWETDTDATHEGIIVEPKPSAPLIDAGQPYENSGKGKGKAPELPDSGLGIGLGVIAALGGASAMRYRKSVRG